MAERRRTARRSARPAKAHPGEAHPSEQLRNEIEMLRSAIRRMYQAVELAEDLDSRARALRALAGSMSGLARLIQIQNELGRGDGFETELAQALEEVQLELGL
jgi:hypothetical protein